MTEFLDPNLMSITFYDPTSGRLIGTVSGGQDTLELNKKKSTLPWVEGAYSDEGYFVRDGKVCIREPIPIYLEDGVFLNIPHSTQVFVNETEYLCRDSSLEIEFDQPGVYKISFHLWPYLPKEFTIENQTQ